MPWPNTGFQPTAQACGWECAFVKTAAAEPGRWAVPCNNVGQLAGRPTTRRYDLAIDTNSLASVAMCFAELVFVSHSWYTAVQYGGVHEQVSYDSGAG